MDHRFGTIAATQDPESKDTETGSSPGPIQHLPAAPTATRTLAPNQGQIGNMLLIINDIRTFTPRFGAEGDVTYFAPDLTGVNTGTGSYGLNPNRRYVDQWPLLRLNSSFTKCTDF
jgi:hypothetical protein